MSWLRRALHLGAGKPEPAPVRDVHMERAQIAAAEELTRQQTKLTQARDTVDLLRGPVDRLGEQIERSLRSIR